MTPQTNGNNPAWRAAAAVHEEAAAMTDIMIRDETTETVITEQHGERHVVLCDEPMTMDEAIALVERFDRPSKACFLIFQLDRVVGLYR